MNNEQLAAEAPAVSPVVEDVTGARIGAAVIDIIICGVIMLIMTILFGESESGDSGLSFSLTGFPFIVALVLVYAYFIVLEALTGQTLGKKLCNLKVVAIGGEYSWGKSFVRNILRLIDGLPFLYLLGFILVVTSKQKQRLGDMAAGTLVVRA